MKKRLSTSLLFSLFVLCVSAQTDSLKTKFIIDIPLLDIPANLDHRGLAFKQFNPSMQQSLGFSRSVAEVQQYYTRRLFFKPGKDYSVGKKILKETGLVVTNLLIESFLGSTPLGTGWTHEEWHRSVMNKNNVRSYNDMNRFPIGQETVAVSHLTDADLERLKKNNNPDFVRMGSAGIEAQNEYVKTLQKDNFYYGLNLSSQVSYWFNNLNSLSYVKLTSTAEGDELTRESEQEEGPNIPKRDFTGLDFVAWIYDLSRPTEPYTARGVHPSGAGIRRYRLTTDLTNEELAYLKKMGRLQVLNLVSPHLFFINSIRINQDLRFNFAGFHYLTSFGYDAGCNFFAEYKKQKIFFAVHNYHNLDNSFYGIEAQLIDKEYRAGRRMVRVTPGIHLWSQPKNQEFRTAAGEFGGRAEIHVSMQVGRIWYPYIAMSAKTRGWAAGDAYLDANFSGRIGIRGFIR